MYVVISAIIVYSNEAYESIKISFMKMYKGEERKRKITTHRAYHETSVAM